LLGSDREGLGL